jgi:hypothetical protein
MPKWRALLGLLALVAVLLTLILPVPSHAPPVRIAAPAPSAPAGDLVHGVISVEGKQVPLPSGEWRVAGQAASPRSVISVPLVRLNGTAADAAVLIQTNRLDSDAGWARRPRAAAPICISRGSATLLTTTDHAPMRPMSMQP